MQLGRATPGAADDNEASGSVTEESTVKRKNKRSRRGAGRPAWANLGSFPVLSGLPVNGPVK